MIRILIKELVSKFCYEYTNDILALELNLHPWFLGASRDPFFEANFSASVNPPVSTVARRSSNHPPYLSVD